MNLAVFGAGSGAEEAREHSGGGAEGMTVALLNGNTRNGAMTEAERERRAVMNFVDSKRKATLASQAFDTSLLAIGALSLLFSGYTAIKTWKQ